jgi:hypothetical protein
MRAEQTNFVSLFAKEVYEEISAGILAQTYCLHLRDKSSYMYVSAGTKKGRLRSTADLDRFHQWQRKSHLTEMSGFSLA